jgi:outer membrane biosynthesis protein TonB
MERTEKVGLGVAAAGHILLFGALSLGWLMKSAPLPPPPPPVDVSLVDDVGLHSQAQQSQVAPTAATAPDTGPAEEAPPPPPVVKEKAPEPAPPVKQPEAAPPPKPSPKPAPPEPKKVARPTPEKAPTPPKRSTSSLSDVMADIHAEGKTADAKGKKQRASVLGDDFRKSLAQGVTKTNSDAPQAARMSAQAMASIASAIQRQVQPCANRQVSPGPGAEQIRVTIRLRLNQDGSLAARPTVDTAADGVDDDNRRYLPRVRDLAIATFVGCAPLRGLPQELYNVPNGWANFAMRYKLPG